jgi:cytochrome c551/c552
MLQLSILDQSLRLILFSIAGIFLCLGLGFYLNFSNQKENIFLVDQAVQKTVVMWCGVVSDPLPDLAEAGKILFRNNCITCHNKNMASDLTGPALGGTEERWINYPQEDLYRWIRNSELMIEEGHPRALELWDTWKPTVMPAFSQFTDEEIESLMMYIDFMNY